MPGTKTANPAPGFAKKPDYRIALTPAGRRMRVVLGCTTVAESDNVLAMREGDYAPVYYFPREDVNIAELKEFARELGEQQGAKEVIISGGARTTGANPGRTPISIRIMVE